jgi:hypothetical protein
MQLDGHSTMPTPLYMAMHVIDLTLICDDFQDNAKMDMKVVS